MKTLSFAVLALSLLAACGDDSGGGTTSGSGGSGGTSSSGGDGDGDGDTSSPSSTATTTTTTTTSGNPTSSSSGGDGGGGVGGGGEFICDDGAAIDAAWECDAELDCEDGSDEAPINPNCPSFTCDDGGVIAAEFECDLIWDCDDLSDEFPTNANCEDPGVPAGWTCMPAFYGADDGCDCGCGAVDADCADATVESCEYCVEPSCAADGSEELTCDTSLLNPADNSQCI